MAKILVAEDDADVRMFLQDELRSAGYTVDAVSNGADAVVAAVEVGYDLFLVDMMMPGLDGIQTIRVLRKITPRSRIIGLTGYVGRGYMAQAASLGVVCLSKPVDLRDLMQEIRVALAPTAGRVQHS